MDEVDGSQVSGRVVWQSAIWRRYLSSVAYFLLHKQRYGFFVLQRKITMSTKTLILGSAATVICIPVSRAGMILDPVHILIAL